VRIAIAIGIVVLGFWVGKFIAGLILKICHKRQIDVTLARFFAGFTRLAIIAFSGMMALSKADTEITPFIVLVGASAFGLSLAIQGPISNYGAGIVLIITRPFKVGDTPCVSGQTGLIQSINLGSTRLENEEEEIITIPNREVLGEIFVNSPAFKVVESVVGIEYAADPEQAMACISTAIKGIAGIAPGRDPDVGIDEFGDSAINIDYRVWVPARVYHKMRYKVNLAIYHALKEAKINIPFPQRDVHVMPGKI